MSDRGGWDDSPADEGRPPICGYCGVTALPGEGDPAVAEPVWICENPDCEAYGQPI